MKIIMMFKSLLTQSNRLVSINTLDILILRFLNERDEKKEIRARNAVGVFYNSVKFRLVF